MAGIPVKVSLAGFQPAEDLILARYRGSAAANGEIDFALVDSTPVKTGAGGGAQVQLATTGAQNGELHLLTVFRPGQATELAKAAYIVGEPLFLRYPFAWGQNFQEGQ